MMARFAPRSPASFAARSTADAWPEMTICSGELTFAGSQIWPWAASRQTALTVSTFMPRTAAIAPIPTDWEPWPGKRKAMVDMELVVRKIVLPSYVRAQAVPYRILYIYPGHCRRLVIPRLQGAGVCHLLSIRA